MGWKDDEVVGGWKADPVVKPRDKAPAQTYDPTEGMSALDRGLAGVGKAMTDVGRGAGQWLGLVSRKDVEEARKLDAPLMKTTGGTVGNVLGNLAMFAPTALIPGANTIAGGALVGAAAGALNPSVNSGETLGHMALGGVAGGAVPAVTRAWQLGKDAMKPLYDSGQQELIGRLLNKVAGPEASQAAARLKFAGTPMVGPHIPGMERATMGELIPGSVPTVGQASGNAGIASLERAATATQPHMTVLMSDLFKTQNEARTNVLRNMAGAGGEREFTAAAREATAEQLYGSARRIGIDPATLTPGALENIAKFSKRIPDAVLSEARMLAKISGTEMTDATSVEGMHWIKKAIDSKIADAAGNKTLQRAYVGLQNDLLDGLDKLSPAYAAARKTYADMSKPLNQMDVAGMIADKSINKTTGNLQPNSFFNALTDKTAARATGLPSATLEGVMDPRQMGLLNSLAEDVRRANTAANAGRGVGSDTVNKLAYSSLMDTAQIPGLLSNWAPAKAAGGLLGRVSDTVYGRANKEMAEKLAEIMLDPTKAAAAMKSAATPEERRMIMEALSRSSAGLLMSAPAIAYGQQ